MKSKDLTKLSGIDDFVYRGVVLTIESHSAYGNCMDVVIKDAYLYND